jgi:hypothetical protein
MNKRVVAVVIQDIGLVVIIGSILMFFLANGNQGTLWIGLLFFGVILTISAFLYLGSEARHSPSVVSKRRRKPS